MNGFEYSRIPDFPAACKALANGARPLGGGTTLVDLMRLGVEAPSHLVDVAALDLDGYALDGPDGLVFGAACRMAKVAEHPTLRANYPALSEALCKAASPQIRNVATLGGNLLQRTRCSYFRSGALACNKRSPASGCAAIGGEARTHALLGGSDACIAVYPGDWAVALLAFDAVLDVCSVRGQRSLLLEKLHRRPGQTPQIETALAADEVITRIRVPASARGRASTYHKVRDRASYAFALASAAVSLEIGADGVVADARIVLGGLATIPWRCRTAEASLVGSLLSEAAAEQAGNLSLDGAETRPDNAFRAKLGAAVVAEALMIVAARS